MTDASHQDGGSLGGYVMAGQARLVPLVAAVVVLIVAGLAGWALAAAVGLSTETYFAGTIPTLVGVVAGLPVALWLIRVGEDVSGRREREAAESRRRLVIEAVRHELQEALAEMKGDRARRPREMVFPFLKTEAWRALADGGDLRWIDDPELIGRIARAYHRIESTTILERAIFDFHNDPVRKSISIPPGAYKPLESLTAWLVQQDEHTIAAIDHALAGVRVALGEA